MWAVKMCIITAPWCIDTVSVSWQQETLLTQLVSDINISVIIYKTEEDRNLRQ
jgi:hypothetical protein